jgi:hypothetical protein
MPKKVKVEGVKQVIKRLYTIKGETAKGMERGIVKAGKHLQTKSQAVVPVDTGAHKASAYTRRKGHGFSTQVTVGYTQDYAIYVHEDLEARHKPGKIAKYLERPARETKEAMAKIIRKEAQK